MPEPGTPVPRPRRRQAATPPEAAVPVQAPAGPLDPPPERHNGAEAPRVSPASLDAEQGVLGAVLIDPWAVDRISGFLQPGDFYRLAHGQIYTAMLGLTAAALPIDLVTLGDELQRRGQLEAVGGPAYLAGLMASVPTATNVEQYARIVSSKALARRMIEVAGRISGMAYEEQNEPEEALSRLRSLVEAVSATWVLGTRAVESVALPDLVAPPDPDAYLVSGFMRPGTLVMLAGPPGGSKSWAARQLGLIAAGGQDDFLKRYQVMHPLNVLVVDEDNGPDEEWRREETLLGHLKLDRSALGRYRRVSLEGVRLDEERWQRWLCEQIERYDLDLLILDPASEFHGGKELREDPSFRSMLAFFKRLKVDYPRLAVLLVHHTRKTEKTSKAAPTSLDEVRGQWGQTPDVVALMWPLGEQRIQWELFKRVPHSKLVLEATPTGAVAVLEDISTVRDRRMTADDKILSAIESGATGADEIRTATGLSKSAVYAGVGRLSGLGLISKRAPFEVLTDPHEGQVAGAQEGGEFVE